MNKKEIFTITLLCFNKDYEKLGDESVEAAYCESFLKAAEYFVARSYDWTFLRKRVKFAEKDRIKEVPYKRLPYAYAKPVDLVKPLFVNGEYDEDIEIIGSVIFFRKPDPELTYTSSAIDYEKFPYPEDFGYYIAYRLAIEISQYLAPNNNVAMEQATQKMQLVMQSLVASEMESTRKKNPRERWFVI